MFLGSCRKSQAPCDIRYRPPREGDTARFPPEHKGAGCLHHGETGHPYTTGEGPAYAEPLFGLSGNPNWHLGNHPGRNAAREVGPHREVSSRSPRPERNIHFENQGTDAIRQCTCPGWTSWPPRKTTSPRTDHPFFGWLGRQFRYQRSSGLLICFRIDCNKPCETHIHF